MQNNSRAFDNTDAPLNPGSWSGLLVNTANEVIGVNTAMIPSAQGLSFAIADNTARYIASHMIQHGQVGCCFIGIKAQNVDLPHHLILQLELESTRGVMVLKLQNRAPPPRLDFHAGMLSYKMAGIETDDIDKLLLVLDGERIEKEIIATIHRKGKLWNEPYGQLPK